MIGKIFGRLVVIQFSNKDKYGHSIWLCECGCNNKTRKNIRENNLINKKTLSCGCLQKEKIKLIGI